MLDSRRLNRRPANLRSSGRPRRSFSLALVVCALSLLLVSCSREEPLGYLSLGDSLAAGIGSSDPAEESYAALHREELRQSTGREVEFRQLGLSGETAESFIGGYPRGDSQLVRAEESLGRNPGSRVTLSLGGNDLLRAREASDTERRRMISWYAEDLELILQTLNGASDPSPQIIVLTLYNPSPDSFTGRWTGLMNEKIRTVSRRNDAAVADGERAFRGHADEYLRYYASGGERDIHPNNRGYAALERAIARAGG